MHIIRIADLLAAQREEREQRAAERESEALAQSLRPVRLMRRLGASPGSPVCQSDLDALTR